MDNAFCCPLKLIGYIYELGEKNQIYEEEKMSLKLQSSNIVLNWDDKVTAPCDGSP